MSFFLVTLGAAGLGLCLRVLGGRRITVKPEILFQRQWKAGSALILRIIIAISALLLLLGLLPHAKGQESETSKVDLYAGYSYVRYNANPRINGVPPSESFGADGITGQAAYNPASRFGIVGELSAYSLSRPGLNTTHQVSYLFGPRVSLGRRFVTPFLQALFGGVWAEDGITLGPVTAFGMTAGGGIDLRVSRYLAVRPVQVEYFMTRFADGASYRQNNLRFGAGIVLRVGRK